jgi:putative DNA primase/helicase
VTARAEFVAYFLGDARREGRSWRATCPVHGGRSLALTDSRVGKLLVHCFAGCTSDAVFAELRARGLIGEGRDLGGDRHEDRRWHDEGSAKSEIEKLRRRIVRAREVYRRAVAAAGSPVEKYLRGRGIAGPIPPALRFLKFYPHRSGRYYPAMVAPIVNVAGEQIGTHKTFLKPDGSGKVDLPRAEQRETCGLFKGGAIRLAPHQRQDLAQHLRHRAEVELLVGEGIESTLSAILLFDRPGWAAICALGIEVLELPPEVRAVAIAADHDANGVGQRAALSARERWISERRSVRILLPPNPGEDFNDILPPAEPLNG